MPREPMKRQGNQSIDSMAEQLAASKAGNKLYKPQYNELSAELKAQALDVAIVQQQELLARADQRGAVDLNDLNAVKIACPLLRVDSTSLEAGEKADGIEEPLPPPA